MAVRTDNGITLNQADGIQNIFVNDWKKAISSRTRGSDSPRSPSSETSSNTPRAWTTPTMASSTSLLHWKAGSAAVSQRELDQIFNGLFDGGGAWAYGDQAVLDCLDSQACSCWGLEMVRISRQIVLAIAIRLAAERLMEDAINDTAFVAGITSTNSTLSAKYREMFPDETDALEVIDLVLLMTPENIHLNSFMYEPILDMSDEHLRKLYARVSELREASAEVLTSNANKAARTATG